MIQKTILVWRALLAALFLSSHALAADISAMYNAEAGTIVVRSLSKAERAKLIAEPEHLKLQVSGQASSRGMLVKLSEIDQSIRINPRFALRGGKQYTLRLSLPKVASFETTLLIPSEKAQPPKLTAFEPSQAVIPANVLRLYLTFSEPMARGQMLNAIKLYRRDGTIVSSPFLNLAPELWDQSQRRFTLLFDPGRIKQGVGPNAKVGSPLKPGESYRLMISGSIQSAAGLSAAQDMELSFRVGAPERRAIEPETWEILTPQAGSLTPVSVTFDRIIDTGAVRRLLKLTDPDGTIVEGEITTDGGSWSLLPAKAWQTGTYHLQVNPELEDISGNNLRASFDAKTGTIGQSIKSETINIIIK